MIGPTLCDALVGGVSHELRDAAGVDPGSCSVLNRMPSIANDRQSSALVEAIGDQAGKLDNEIRDLLNATRISAKGVLPQMIWTDPTDIVNAALKQKERRLASHWVTVDLARDVPLVHVDLHTGGTGVRAASGKRCRSILRLAVRSESTAVASRIRGVVGQGSG